jgi:hypothetical protein
MEIPEGLEEQYPDYQSYWVLRSQNSQGHEKIPFGKIKPKEFIKNEDYLKYMRTMNKQFRNAEARLLSEYHRQKSVLNKVEEFLKFKKVAPKATKYSNTKHGDINYFTDVELAECMAEIGKLKEKVIDDLHTFVNNGSIAIVKVQEFVEDYDRQRHRQQSEAKKRYSKH